MEYENGMWAWLVTYSLRWLRMRTHTHRFPPHYRKEYLCVYAPTPSRARTSLRTAPSYLPLAEAPGHALCSPSPAPPRVRGWKPGGENRSTEAHGDLRRPRPQGGPTPPQRNPAGAHVDGRAPAAGQAGRQRSHP